MNIMFPRAFSFQEPWKLRKVICIEEPTHCKFSYAVTFLSYIRTNSKLLFQDITLIKIKGKHYS